MEKPSRDWLWGFSILLYCPHAHPSPPPVAQMSQLKPLDLFGQITDMGGWWCCWPISVVLAVVVCWWLTRPRSKKD